MKTLYAPMYPDELELLMIAFSQIWVRVELDKKGYSKQDTWPSEEKKANANWVLKVYFFVFQNFLPAFSHTLHISFTSVTAFKFNLKLQVSKLPALRTCNIVAVIHNPFTLHFHWFKFTWNILEQREVFGRSVSAGQNYAPMKILYVSGIKYLNNCWRNQGMGKDIEVWHTIV